MKTFTLWIQRVALYLIVFCAVVGYGTQILGRLSYSDVIAFTSYRDGPLGDLYALDFNSGIILRLTDNEIREDYAAWSPTSPQIAYNCLHEEGWDICLLDVITDDSHRLTRNTANDYWPSWSPDGTHLLFYSSRDGNNELYRMNTDGSDVQRLTFSENNDALPQYSPDGTQIAFTSEWDLYVMDVLPDGSVDYANRQQLTFSPGYDSQATWSPDGRYLLYASDMNSANTLNLFVIGVSESSETHWLEYTRANSFSPVWSPDGSHVLFGMRIDGGEPLLYLLDMLPDGSAIPGSERLLDTRGRAWSPAWMP